MRVTIKYKKVDSLIVPTQAKAFDAGYDVFAASEPNIVGVKFDRPADGVLAWQRVDYIEYRTGLFLEPQDLIALGGVHKIHAELWPRSSISKKNMMLANSIGLVDNGYRNELLFRFKYIFQPEDLILIPESGRMRIYGMLSPESVYKKGDAIGQIVASPNVEIDFVQSDELTASERGLGGFGSSNR